MRIYAVHSFRALVNQYLIYILGWSMVGDPGLTSNSMCRLRVVMFCFAICVWENEKYAGSHFYYFMPVSQFNLALQLHSSYYVHCLHYLNIYTCFDCFWCWVVYSRIAYGQKSWLDWSFYKCTWGSDFLYRCSYLIKWKVCW